MVPGIKDGRAFDIYINNVKIKNSDKVKLLEIKVNKNLVLEAKLVKFAGENHTKFMVFRELGSF